MSPRFTEEYTEAHSCQKTSRKVSAFSFLHSLAIYRCSSEEVVRAGRGAGSRGQGGVAEPELTSTADPLWLYSMTALGGLEEDAPRSSGFFSNNSRLNPFFGDRKRKAHPFDHSLLSNRLSAGHSLSAVPTLSKTPARFTEGTPELGLCPKPPRRIFLAFSIKGHVGR